MKANEIDLDEVDEIAAKRARINRIDIRRAVFTRGGKVIEVSDQDRAEFRFTGLSTIDFVLTNYSGNLES